MKLSRFSVIATFALLAAAFIGGCSDDDEIDNRDRDYGYIQFKLYKEASYEAAPQGRAVKQQLDYLSEATKIKVSLSYGETTIAQTLLLSAADKQAAEFGMRSDKLRLLAGIYRITAFSLYDAADQLIYNGSPDSSAEIEVVAGGLTVHDLTANVVPRGSVRFTLKKDLSAFEHIPSRAANREYTFDEIKYADVTVAEVLASGNTANPTRFEKLPVEFSIHFDEDNEANGTPGYQTSSLTCDTLLSLPAGDYRIIAYETYDTNKSLLETQRNPNSSDFRIDDNKTQHVDVKITLYEADEYLKDYYALYEIWKALDGPNWSYQGENYPAGQNWNFNKDPDLWGDQPGVFLHSNGRVASISISDFGFGGHVPAAIGQLSELISLDLGTHNDNYLIHEDPQPSGEKLSRAERNKRYLQTIHPATQFSEPIARALKEHDIAIPEIALYEHHTEDELIDRTTGGQRTIRPHDTTHGVISNRLEYIDEAIGNLKRLETLYIANSTIGSLPEALSQLESCTDFELYNCPNVTKFPIEITRMPALIQINISNNRQWSSEELYAGLDALARADASKEKPTLQVLYCNENNLHELPESFKGMKSLHFLDLTDNKLEKLNPLGKDINLASIYLDHNMLTSIPCDENGYFCGFEALETFSATHNQFTKLPDIFNARNLYKIETIDFSYNHIDGCENEGNGYRGVYVSTLTLSNNPELTKYPKALTESNSAISYINLRGCSIDEIPKGSFDHKYAYMLTALDLSYNKLSELPNDLTALKLPYLYGVELSYNMFSTFPYNPLDCSNLTVYSIRGQRDANGKRCLRTWPTGIYQHKGLRALYIGSNDLRKIDDTISTICYYLDISDNPNITFDASDICYAWKSGVYILIYDKTQNILNCEEMLK